MDLWLIWMLAALLLFLVEIFTPGFAAACLSIGCLFSCVLAAIAPDTLNWQIGLFVVGSLLSFIFVRPFALKVLSRRALARRTIKKSASPAMLILFKPLRRRACSRE